MKKNYNNYLSARFYQGMIKLSLLIVMLLLVTTTTFAQYGKTVKVSNDNELTEARNNPAVESAVLEASYYESFGMTMEEGTIVSFGKDSKGANASVCDYFIQPGNWCWEVGVVTATGTAIAGTNSPDILNPCTTLEIGLWTYTSTYGTLTFTGDPTKYICAFEVNAPGEYLLTYTWGSGSGAPPNTKVTTSYYFYTQIEITEFTAPPVCGLEAQITFTVDDGGFAYPADFVDTTFTLSGGGLPSPVVVTPVWSAGQFALNVTDCGTYDLLVEVAGGPCGTVSETIEVMFFDEAVVSVPAYDEVCALETNFLASYTATCENGAVATESFTYLGPGMATIVAGVASYSWDITVTQCGIYTVTYKVENGPCTTTDSFVINFVDEPVITVPADYEACGLFTEFPASYLTDCNAAIETDTWSYVGPIGGTATIVWDIVNLDWDITVSDCGIYTLTYTVENGPCESFDSFVINFVDEPVITVPAEYDVCGFETTFDAYYDISCLAGLVTDSFTYDGPGTATITDNIIKKKDAWYMEVSQCGIYTVTYTVENGPCLSEESFVINFFDSPVVNAGPDADYCFDALPYQLAPSFTAACQLAGTPTETWTLEAGDGPGTATFTLDNKVTVSVCGSYTFTFTVENGPCTVSDVVVIDFFDTPVLTVETPETPTEVCGYETGYMVSYLADCKLGTVTQTVEMTAGPVGGTATVTFCDLVKGPGPCTDNIVVSECGVYTFTYTVVNGPCTETIDFAINFYEIPSISIAGTTTPTFCKEYTYSVTDGRTCQFGAVTNTWTIDGGYFKPSGLTTATTISDGSAATELTVVWDDNVSGPYTLTVYGESIAGSCTDTFTLTVVPEIPVIAGQVKYWNEEETYMPTPFPTIEGASYPHDYFYVTLHNSLDDVAIDTLIVEPYLDEVQTGTDTWTTIDLMSFFGVDLGNTYTSTLSIFNVYGCEGYYLKIWDGGLVYHQNPPTYDAVLGANYTYNNWGGVNATDALAIQLMATNINIAGAPYNFNWIGPNTETPRFGYYSSSAANVNSSTQTNPITALDALTTNYRAVGLMDVFPYLTTNSGRYSPNFRVTGRMVSTLPEMTWNTPFDLDNVPDVVFNHNAGIYNNYLYYDLATNHQYVSEPLSLLNTSYINIYYLAAGDINSSYIPTSAGFKMATPEMSLEYTDEMIVSKGDVVTIPIRVDRNAELGAISLDLTYNASLIEVLGVNYDKENFKVDAEKGTLRIGWFSPVPSNFASGDAIAMIQVRVLADINTDTRFFELGANTDLADANALSLKDIKLQTSAINTLDAGLFITNYPNPFNGKTMISYNLPSASKVTLVVYNTMSQVVETLVSSYQEAGTHEVEFGSTDLKAGVYYYRIIVENEGNTVVETNSMIHMQ